LKINNSDVSLTRARWCHRNVLKKEIPLTCVFTKTIDFASISSPSIFYLDFVLNSASIVTNVFLIQNMDFL